jgi:hypothetical protein
MSNAGACPSLHHGVKHLGDPLWGLPPVEPRKICIFAPISAFRSKSSFRI